MDYQQFLFTITAGLQSACQAEEKITVQTIEQKHTAKIKTVSLYHRGKRTTPWIYMAPFYRLYQHGYSMESIQKELKNVLDMVTENNKVEGEVFTNFECAAAFLSVRLISYKKIRNFYHLFHTDVFLILPLSISWYLREQTQRWVLPLCIRIIAESGR